MAPSLSARAQDAPTVEIHDNFFSPAEIHVAEGGTVRWNDYGGNHSVTSDDGVSFDSSPGCSALPLADCMNSNANNTFKHQFRIPETVTYHCRVHGSAMVGKVIVDPAATTTTSSTTTTTTASSSETSTSLASDQPAITQASLPSLPSTSHVALPKSIIRSKSDDGTRLWVLVAIGVAGATAITGIVLVRRGRVPLG